MIMANIYIVWVFIYILSFIYLIRIGWQLKQSLVKDEKFLLSKTELIGLWITLAYFISYIIWLI